MLVSDADGTTYVVPMTYRGAPLAGADEALIGTSEHGVLGRRWIYDGAATLSPSPSCSRSRAATSRRSTRTSATPSTDGDPRLVGRGGRRGAARGPRARGSGRRRRRRGRVDRRRGPRRSRRPIPPGRRRPMTRDPRARLDTVTDLSERDIALPDGRTLHMYDAGGDGLPVVWLHGTPNLGPPPRPLFGAAAPARRAVARLRPPRVRGLDAAAAGARSGPPPPTSPRSPTPSVRDGSASSATPAAHRTPSPAPPCCRTGWSRPWRSRGSRPTARPGSTGSRAWRRPASRP